MLNPVGGILVLIGSLLNILSFLILVDVLLSWAWFAGMRWASPYQPWVQTLRRFTEPVLSPIRALVPPRMLQGLDISPLIALLVLQFLGNLLVSIGR